MPSVADRARALQQRGMSAVGVGRPDEGARLLRAGLRLLEPHPGERALSARLMISLAAAEVLLGNSEFGLRLLDQAAEVASPEDMPILHDQRGWVYMYIGMLDDALACMSEALPLLEAGDDAMALASCLLNRAMVHELAGRVRLSRADLRRCEEIARSARLTWVLDKVLVNLGYCEMLSGDVPAALRAFDQASADLLEHAPDLLPPVAVDKARVLLTAGLAVEAAVELDTALVALSGTRDSHERAEAELIRARTALALGKPAEARKWAGRAERRFTRRGNATWASLAVLTRLRADFADSRPARAIAARAETLADLLSTLGLPHDAEVAALLAARAHVRSRDVAEALRLLSSHRTPRPMLEARLLRRLTTAELHLARGRDADSLSQARDGLALLREHRVRLGSVDLQTSTTALGGDLARIGLSTSLRAGKPHVVFNWLERTRAQAFQVSQARPRSDPIVADTVAALRQAALAVREGELAGRPDVVAQRRCAELERVIRAHGWQTDGSGRHLSPAGFGDVASTLAATSSVLASFYSDGDALGALVIADGVGRLVALGSLAAVSDAAARLRGDLDATCGRTLPPALTAVVEASAARQIAVLTDCLVTPLLSLLGDRDLVVVPSGPLATVPWNLLPGLRGRPVTVAVSASAWCRAASRAPIGSSEPLLVAGPHLSHAVAEVHKIAEVFPASTVLCGSDATVAATLSALDGRRSVHFAAHGHHEPGNFLFSRLDLADGPLMAYDIHQLPTVPEHVVLSSCDIGRNVVRTGNEMLGFTAALLYSGTSTVIAGVCRVPDEVSLKVMTVYHQLRALDVRPAAALAAATENGPPVPLVCFGYG